MSLDVSSEGDQYRELGPGAASPELLEAVQGCTRVVRARTMGKSDAPDPDAQRHTSVHELDRLLREGADVSDLRTDDDLSSCVVLHTGNLPGSLLDDEVITARHRVDRVVTDQLHAWLGDERATPAVSGHLWYPAGSYMRWHTNTRVPGWRVYVTYVEEPGRSYFRYREPDTGAVVTSWDRGLDVRLFQLRSGTPLWHCVYAGTPRHSFGYRIMAGDGEAWGNDDAA